MPTTQHGSLSNSFTSDRRLTLSSQDNCAARVKTDQVENLFADIDADGRQDRNALL
jgi:hypothetical protein